jgi:hypothetical protein
MGAMVLCLMFFNRTGTKNKTLIRLEKCCSIRYSAEKQLFKYKNHINLLPAPDTHIAFLLQF